MEPEHLPQREGTVLLCTRVPSLNTELIVEKTIDLFLDGQNQFLAKEIRVRPMSSSATSTSSQSVICMGR
jgi:hypothetical protein